VGEAYGKAGKITAGFRGGLGKEKEITFAQKGSREEWEFGTGGGEKNQERSRR